MELRFWGVRGSIPKPGQETSKVGGNTTCVSLRLRDYIFVFDAGTGIRELGKYLEDKDLASCKGILLLTHYHWDHIQGLPFFTPAFRKENRFSIYGEPKKGTSIHEILSDQMEPPYFPVALESLEGLVTFFEIKPNLNFEILPKIFLRTIRLNHPGSALGYRLDTPEGSVCIITDHEHPKDKLSNPVLEFVYKANILVHDAQYTPKEKKNTRSGWGHSSWEEAAVTALLAKVDQLYLIHHDPDRTDDDLDAILSNARQIFPNTKIATEKLACELKKGGGEYEPAEFKKLILTLPDHIYQGFESLAVKHQKSICEMIAEILINHLEAKSSAREYKKQIIDYLNDQGAEKLNA
jgi:phosphoribosyl 1,2-cyclic phosphodiesterase